jgi:hypothetical protein
MKRHILVAVAVSAGLLGGCASSYPPVTAPTKTLSAKGQRIALAGVYTHDKNEVVITADGAPLLKGGFPPFTPTLHMSGEHKGVAIRAQCYFASVLATKRGIVGAIGRNVQSNNSKTTDTCDIYADEKQVDSLVFPSPAIE